MYYACAWYKNRIIMEIKILGTGFGNCENLEKATRMTINKFGNILSLWVYISLIVAVLSAGSCTNRDRATDETKYKPQTPVEVIFFHTNYRCESCEAIKSETAKIIREIYGNKVHFTIYNLDEKSGRGPADQLGIRQQTLLVISEGKQSDITAIASLYALANPEKYREKLKETIDSMMP